MTSAWLVLWLATGAAPKVASPTWNAVDVKPELVRFYAEQLATALRAEGLEVTTADDIGMLLGQERQRQLLGCSTESTSCLAELAAALGCDATLTVSLARLGKGYRGLAKLMSSRDGSVLSSVKLEAASEDELADALERAGKALAAPLKARVAPPPVVEVARVAPPPRVAPKLWWVPGAAGALVAAGGALGLAVAGGTFDELHRTTPLEDVRARELVARGELAQGLGWAGVGLGAAALTGSVLWLVLGSTDAPPAVSVVPLGPGLAVGGTF